MCGCSSSSSTELSPRIGRRMTFASPACSSRGSPVKTCLTASGSESTTHGGSLLMRMVNMSPKRALLRSRNGPVRVVQARVWTARGMDGPGGRPVAAGAGAAVVAGAPTVVALMRGPPGAWERWARERVRLAGSRDRRRASSEGAGSAGWAATGSTTFFSECRRGSPRRTSRTVATVWVPAVIRTGGYSHTVRYVNCERPSADEDLRRALLQPRRRPAQRPQRLRVARGHEVDQLAVLGRLRALGEQGPVNGRLRGRQVQPAQVAQQQQARFGAPADELGGLLAHGAQRPARAARSGRVGVEVEIEPLARLRESARVPMRPPAERPRQMEDVVVGLVALAQLEQLVGQQALGAVDGAQGEVELHDARSRRTAATFRSGCLEFGSQAVSVSSLAAR